MVAARRYIPERGDVVWVSFDPTRGHEQQGHRPALVISPRIYNAASSLMLACPITSHCKGYPFEVNIRLQKAESAVLVDQIRSIDWRERKVRKITTASAQVFEEVQEKLGKLIG